MDPAAARPSLAVLISAAMALSFAMAGLCRGTLWPSSDLEGHVAAVELLRQGLLHGELWPFDRRSAGGCVAAACYAWPFELTLAGAAQLLVACGVAHAARWMVMVTLVGGVCVLPLSAAWCSRRLAGGHRAAAHAGALAAWVFLATHSSDGISGYGMDAVALGLVAQILGWNVLLLVAGRVAVPVAGRWDPLLSALVAALVLLHSLSALAGAVLVGCAALRAPMRILPAALVGLAGGAMSLMALLQVRGALIQERPWLHLQGEDPLCAWLDRTLFAASWSQALPNAAQLGGLLGVIGAWWALRRRAPARVLVWAALVLVAVASLPGAQLCLPAAAQLYRLHAPAWLLLLVAAASQAPPLLAWLRGRVAPWVLRCGLAALWLALGRDQLAAWRVDPPQEQPAALWAELPVRVPPGSRVLVADQPGGHRWMVEEWKDDQDWESLGCLQTALAPPLLTAVEPAAARLGLRLCGVAPPLPGGLSVATAVAMLRECGVTHALRRRLDTDPSVPAEAGTLPWPCATSAHWSLWTAPDPLPRISPCTHGIVELVVPPRGSLRRLVAMWALRRQAVDACAPRLALLADAAGGSGLGADPLPSAAVDATAAAAGAALPRLAVDWSQLPDGAMPGWLRDQPPGAELAAAVWQALTPVAAELERWQRHHGTELGSAPPAHPPASLPAPPRLCWRDPNTLEISALVPRQPYLLRYAWSPDMRCVGGRLCADGCGMILLSADGAQLRITVHSCTPPVQIGCGVTLAVLIACLVAWLRQRPAQAPARRPTCA